MTLKMTVQNAGWVGLSSCILVMLAAILSPVVAQEKKAESTAEATQAPTPQAEWTKICGPGQGDDKAETCLTVNETRTQSGEFLASVAIEEVKGSESERQLRLAVPVGLLIQPGLVLNVDDKRGIPARFTVCLPNLCYATASVKDEVLDQMKNGSQLNIAGRNMQGKEIDIKLSLAGFTKAVDGPPIDTESIKAEHDKLKESMKQRAEEERKKLLNNQN